VSGVRPPEHEQRQWQLRIRRVLLLTGFGLAGVAVLGRAFQLQALESEAWVVRAAEQQRERSPLPARRGAIYDRDGVPLALSHETFRISVAPRELRDRRAMAARLRETLGITTAQAERATDPQRPWVVLPGRFSVEQRDQLGEQRGIYYERQLERFYPQGRVAREVIGSVSGDGRALGGIEQQFDSVLRGEPGYSVLRRDARGRARAAISLPVVAPRDGADVYLTIDLDLQEIADGALRSAIREAGASGGDLVVLNPRTGEVLAAVSQRTEAHVLAAITEPYEPGSTLKPLLAAVLLAEGRLTPDERVWGERGRWQLGTRTISDSHVGEWMTLTDIIRVSSNIGIVKLGSRLTAAEQYQYLRDFGFGSPSGVEFPAESTGRLRRPREWSRLSAASLAMGYEISVTPLQLAAAYGALANSGVLMETHLLREVRRDGRVLERREPRELRRVIPEEVAAQVTEMLTAVVDQGTATRAGLQSFRVAGKTGTSRRTGAGGGYETGSYISSFAGYFPAADPQLVILVKIDQPRGAYYGGLVAAPVSRETLQGILATHSSPLDRGTLLASRVGSPSGLPLPARFIVPPRALPEASATLAVGAHLAPDIGSREEVVVVPPLEGLTFREAARRAHEAGLHVRLSGAGRVARIIPEPGTAGVLGDTLKLFGESR
jgi:cell division protein FtsI (penicillin-binding protein 3)